MNKVHSILILSRSVKGRPLKAFLEYNKPKMDDEKEKQGFISKLLGGKPKERDEGEFDGE